MSSNTSIATVDANGIVTGVTVGETTITVKAFKNDGTTVAASTTVSVTVKEICATPTITFTPSSSGSTATVAISTATSNATIYYTIDGSEPTTSSTEYDGTFSVDNGQTVKAIAVKDNYFNSEIASSTYTATKVATPTINITASGVTFSSETPGATFYYTINDADISTSSTSGSSIALSSLSDGDIIRVIATKSGMLTSDTASKTYYTPTSVSGGKVTLNDYEPHSWAYYSDPDCPIRSLSPADVKITYLGNGVMMKTTDDYTAGTTDTILPGNANYVDTAFINIPSGEHQDSIVYYKTLERGANTTTAYTYSTTHTTAASRCPYITIPNPFQVRPTYGTAPSSDRANWTGWRGFQCWRLKGFSGGEVYSAASGGTALDTGAIINAETQIYFAPDSEYNMTVELEAVWSIAYLVYANGNGAWSVPNHADKGYERNFVVLASKKDFYFNVGNGANTAYITNIDRPATITPYLPNGTSGNNQIGKVQGEYNQNADNSNITLQAKTKFENVQFASMSQRTLTADGNDLIIGRGCSGTINYVRGSSGSLNNSKYTIRIESGTFNFISYILGYQNPTGTATSTSAFNLSGNDNMIKGVLGSDYDRAVEKVTGRESYDYANAPLKVVWNMILGNRNQQTTYDNQSTTHDLFQCTIKSGYYGSSFGEGTSYNYNNTSYVNAGDASQSFYIGTANAHTKGSRTLNIEGGKLNLSLAGGIDQDNNVTDAVKIRIYGGWITRSIYGAAAFSGSKGNRRFIITGGQIDGWIAGGCNGTMTSGGDLAGSTYIYVGGTSNVGNTNGGIHVGGNITVSNGQTTSYGRNGADGGNIFGAGCGILSTNSSYTPNEDFKEATVGNVDNSTIVVADEAHVWRDVHGGGNYGWVRANGTSTIFVAGNAIIGGNDGCGHVFGGSNNQKGQTVTINVKGGDVKGGVYGGSHSWGTINNNVTMNISGGLIETGAFGGGYGTNQNSCDVSGTVNINMTGGTVLYGLYGGGNVRSTISQNVKMNIDGGQVGLDDDHRANIHGGGYGANTGVNGNVTLNLGTCGATSGVTVYGDVYGGSAKGTVNNATTDTTTVSLYKGTIYGGLYGGGYGPGGENANVNGKVYVKVFGGSVLCSSNDPDGVAGTGSVFGCNNVSGSPQSSVNVDIYNTDQPLSGYALHAVYGGGNKSAYTSTPVVTIHGCDNKIEYVYGGGNATNVRGTDVTIWGGYIGNAFAGGNGAGAGNPGANITNDGAQLTIHGGTILAAFGGSNEKGTINGGISVNVRAATESNTGRPACVDAYEGCAMDIGELYGGGNKAPIQTSSGTWINPSVKIGCNANIGMLFGGAKAADYTGNINLVVNGGTFEKVFGGNNQGGTITGDVTVTINGGHAGDVYGGCNESGTITGKITVVIDSVNDSCGQFYVENVYGGGNLAAYTAPTSSPYTGLYPEVNIINGTVRENVYGGGLGNTAEVTGNPVVTVGENTTKRAKVLGSVFGGGNAAPITGNTLVKILYKSRVYGNIYGGGNQGPINGNTKVIVNSD